MRKKIITLGGGMVGSVIARDLKKSDYFVTVADQNENLKDYLDQFSIGFVKLDFSDLMAVSESIKDFDLVVGAVPGSMGYEILKTVQWYLNQK